MSSLKRRRSDEADDQPDHHVSNEPSDDDTIDWDSEAEMEHEKYWLSQCQGTSATGVGGQLTKRRRQGRPELSEQSQAEPRFATPPSTLALNGSWQVEVELPDEESDEEIDDGEVDDDEIDDGESDDGIDEDSQDSMLAEGVLRWKDMPYPNFPVSPTFPLLLQSLYHPSQQ
jgi:hypothetical protein